VKHAGNPIVHRGGGVFGPGHGCVVTDAAGTLWHVYHQQRDERKGWNRFICIDPLWFDAAGVLHGKATRGTPQPVPAIGTLRQRAEPEILHEELAPVEAALARHGEAWQYRPEVKKATITVHEASDLGGLDGLYGEFRGRRMSAEEKKKSAHYRPMMRFTLADKETRAFKGAGTDAANPKPVPPRQATEDAPAAGS
jgi:hypothetical protein